MYSIISRWADGFFLFLREGGRKQERKVERKEPGELFKLLQRRDPEVLVIKCYTVGDCFNQTTFTIS